MDISLGLREFPLPGSSQEHKILGKFSIQVPLHLGKLIVIYIIDENYFLIYVLN